MTSDRATRALARAVKDLRHARAMAALDFSPAAVKRHERRAARAEAGIRAARRELAMSGLMVEA